MYESSVSLFLFLKLTRNLIALSLYKYIWFQKSTFYLFIQDKTHAIAASYSIYCPFQNGVLSTTTWNLLPNLQGGTMEIGTEQKPFLHRAGILRDSVVFSSSFPKNSLNEYF